MLTTTLRYAALALLTALGMGLTGCGGGGGGAPPANVTATITTPTVTVTPSRSSANVSITVSIYAEGVSVDPATGDLYVGTGSKDLGGDYGFALLRATATQTSFSDWLSAAGILPGTPSPTTPSGAFIVGTRVQSSAIYFCVSNPVASTAKVMAYQLSNQAKVAEFALPAGFCNDLAFDSAGNLFVTANDFVTPAPAERIYKLSASVVATGTASAASWAAWYTAPAGFKLNGLAFDAPNNRLLWADNSNAAGNTKIQASTTSGSTASPTAVVSNLALDIDGLQITSKGNLIAIDHNADASNHTGARHISLGTGTPGTVTSLADGTQCATTVALYKADAWCSDSVGAVYRLVGAGDL
jgi:hypothetical protein